MKKAALAAATVVLLALIIGVSGCGGDDPKPWSSFAPEPEVPPHFTTYTDESSLFSISYPPDWEPALSVLGELEEAVSDIILSVESDLPIEEIQYLFLAGLPNEAGLNPNVLVVVEPMPTGTGTIDSVVEAEVRGVKAVAEEYHEFSRTKTNVGGREAVIVDLQAVWPGTGETRALQMYVLHGKNVWAIACTTDPGPLGSYGDVFHDVLGSFRILR